MIQIVASYVLSSINLKMYQNRFWLGASTLDPTGELTMLPQILNQLRMESTPADFQQHFVTNFLQSAPVKKNLRKSVEKRQSYRYDLSVLFFWNIVYYYKHH